jgi:hypothetical protein
MPSSMRPQQRRHCRPRPPLQVAPNHITTPSRLFKVTTNTMTSTSIMKSGDDSVMFDEDYNKHTKAKTMMVLYPWRTNNQAKMLPRRRRWPVTSTRNKNKPNGVDAINEKQAAAENRARDQDGTCHGRKRSDYHRFASTAPQSHPKRRMAM